MTPEKFDQICKKAMGTGEPAGSFAKHVPVWSEMDVRAAILEALTAAEAMKHPNYSVIARAALAKEEDK